jgi:hypothetical protein
MKVLLFLYILRIIAALRKFGINFFEAAMTNGKSGALAWGRREGQARKKEKEDGQA